MPISAKLAKALLLLLSFANVENTQGTLVSKQDRNPRTYYVDGNIRLVIVGCSKYEQRVEEIQRGQCVDFKAVPTLMQIRTEPHNLNLILFERKGCQGNDAFYNGAILTGNVFPPFTPVSVVIQRR